MMNQQQVSEVAVLFNISPFKVAQWNVQYRSRVLVNQQCEKYTGRTLRNILNLKRLRNS